MLRERLREIDLRITELADYLQVSRPTMYKFIEYYDNTNFDLINRKVLRLFNYIVENELAGKKNIVSYILNNLTEVKELGSSEDKSVIKNIKNYIISNPDSQKSKFFELCSKKTTYDEVLIYLMEIYPLLKKKNLTEQEMARIQPYNEIKDKIKILKKEEKEEI